MQGMIEIITGRPRRSLAGTAGWQFGAHYVLSSTLRSGTYYGVIESAALTATKIVSAVWV